MSSETDLKSRHNLLPVIIIAGTVLVLGNLAFIGWKTGMLKQKEKVALVTWNQDPFWDLVVQGANDAAKDLNVDLTVVQSTPDENDETQHVKDLLAAGVRGIAISPNNSITQKPFLETVAAKAALVTIDSDVPIANRIGFVGTDNFTAGQATGDEVRAAIPHGGEVIISVGSIDMNNGRERREGLIHNLMDRHGKSDADKDPIDAVLKTDKYQIVATVVDHGVRAKATSAIADAIKAHPDVKCIVGLFSYSAPSIVKAIDSVGRKGQIKVIGFDELDETQAGVSDGSIYSSILQDQYRCGREAVIMMVAALRGTNQAGPAGPRIVPTRILVMRAENIQDLRTDKLIHQPPPK